MEFIYILLTLGLTLFAFAVIWGINLRIEDASIVDFYWAPGFVVIALAGLFLQSTASFHQMVLVAALILWASQLTLYMVARHKRRGEEDARYKVWRKAGGDNYWWRSLYKVFLLQAVILWFLATPVHAVFGGAALIEPSPIFWASMLVFAIGLVIEAIADYQIFKFGALEANKNKVYTDGLWRYSRHPNYFGESLVWLGLGFAAYDLTGQIYALLGPLVLTFLLVRVSGVPILEKQLKTTKLGYAAYMSRTSSFIPLPPKSDNASLPGISSGKTPG